MLTNMQVLFLTADLLASWEAVMILVCLLLLLIAASELATKCAVKSDII